MHLQFLDSTDAFLSHATPSVQTYFDGFTTHDVHARKPYAHSLNAYLGNLVPSAAGRAKPVARAIAVAIETASAAMAGAALPPALLLQDNTLPWRIALFTPEVERGWPHTHGEVLCFPMVPALFADPWRLAELLVHERIHVLQRMRPQETRDFIRMRYGLAPFTPRALLPPSRRAALYANPDVDQYVYEHVYEHVYGGDYTSAQQHPYETMAYEMAAEAIAAQKSSSSFSS